MKEDISFLFNSVSLYTKKSFQIFNLQNNQYVVNQSEYDAFLGYIGTLQKKMITYCHKCKREFPFDIDWKLFSFSDDDKIFYWGMRIANDHMGNPCVIRLRSGDIDGQPPYEKNSFLENRIWYLQYHLQCAHDENHKYIMMISIELQDGKFTVRKIGQNPSMFIINGFNFDRYKKFLTKIDAYKDYKKADLSNADHYYIGAYTYLRRIFEKMIGFYLGDIELPDNRTSTKIDAVKDKFDPRVRDYLNNLYGILNISIHEIDEEQSKTYYIYLKAITDMQLEYIKSEEDKDSQLNELGEILNKMIDASKNKQ